MNPTSPTGRNPEFLPSHQSSENQELETKRSPNYQRVHFIDSGYPDLVSLRRDFGKSIHTVGRTTPHLLTIEAPPGAGKTYLVQQKLLPWIEKLSQKLYTSTGEHLNFSLFHWDEIENDVKRLLILARAALPLNPTLPTEFDKILTDALQTPRYSELSYYQLANLFINSLPIAGEPYDPEFLLLTALTLKTRVSDFLQTPNPYTFALIDKVGGIGLRLPFETDWVVGREFANEMMEDISARHPPFDNLGGIVTGYIGLVPGPYQNVELEYQNIRNQVTHLKEANEMAAAFHKPRYKTIAEIMASKEGGSRAQIELSRQIISQLIVQYQDYLDLPSAVSYAINLPYSEIELLSLDIPLPPTTDPNLIKLARQCHQVAGLIDQPPFYIYWQACWALAEARILEKVAIDSHVDYSCIALNNPTPPKRAKRTR